MFSVVQEIENTSSIFPLVPFARCLDDLEVNFILYETIKTLAWLIGDFFLAALERANLSHQGNRKTRECSTAQHKSSRKSQIKP